MPGKLDRHPLSKFYEDFHLERQKAGTVSAKERLAFIAEEVGKGKDVVELGCRFGGLLKHFVQGNRVTGVDIDRKALEECSKTYRIPTVFANLNEPLPLPDNSFDVVVLSEVLEHLPYPDITLSEAARVCRDEGKIVGSVPNGIRLKNRIRFLLGGPVDTDPTHLHHFSVDSLIKLVSKYFEETAATLVAGRFVPLSSQLFANLILFSGKRPKRGERLKA